MNILVTGAKGMVGTALVANLKNIQEQKNRTRPNLHIDEIYEYDINSTLEELEEYCGKAGSFGGDTVCTTQNLPHSGKLPKVLEFPDLMSAGLRRRHWKSYGRSLWMDNRLNCKEKICYNQKKISRVTA